MKALLAAFPPPKCEPQTVTSSASPYQWYLGSELLLGVVALYCIIVTHLELPFSDCPTCMV